MKKKTFCNNSIYAIHLLPIYFLWSNYRPQKLTDLNENPVDDLTAPRTNHIENGENM